MTRPDARALFDDAIRTLLGDAMRLVARDPLAAASFAGILAHQKAAERRRLRHVQHGIPVPALLILSVTQRCNLHCAGCYAGALHQDAGPELSTTEMGSILEQASELGVSIVLLAGGEPLTRGDLLELTRDRPDMMFALFTNGTLLHDEIIRDLARQRHVIPVLSLEGHQIDTDTRRGEGIHARVLEKMGRLKDQGLFFGTSLTVTRQNYDVISDPAFAQDLIESGCHLFFFVEYVPTLPGTEFLVLTEAQRAGLGQLITDLHDRLPGLFISLPGDEELYGGCLAAGNGFVHIDSHGRLEPCPFAPWSDRSLREVPLADALCSPFLAALRSSDVHLAETAGGCALWAHREEVTALLQANHVLTEPGPAL
ncbi:MAG: radical SAM protein [Chloroflexi bacterium]|nr:radical SAM protein [Chloroflexota bacterium]